MIFPYRPGLNDGAMKILGWVCLCGIWPAMFEGNPRSVAMKSMNRSLMVLAVAVSMAGLTSFAQPGGDATYKAKCAMCHGAAGTPSAGMAKMGIKPVSDPEIKALTVAQISAVVKAGKGKMKPVAGLTDPQVTAVATFFKSLK
jgi:mono/diheme cytochrome c family protein